MKIETSRQPLPGKSLSKNLSSSEQKIIGLAENIVKTLREPILVLDKNLRIITANPSFYQTFEVSQIETLNKRIFQLGNNQWDIPELRKLLEEIIPRHQEFHDFEVDHVFDQLGRRIMLLNAKRILGHEHEQVLILLAIEDITERRQLEAKLAKAAEKLDTLSITDELTSLYNRRGFLKFAQQQLKLAERLKHKMFLFFMDLDGLKMINDQFGHRGGDQALVDLANILKKTFRESDIVARFGGDEFVVLGFETAGKGLENAAFRFQKNLKDHYAKGTYPYELSVSVGIAYYDPTSPSSVDELLAQADKMMYVEKQRSK